MNEAEEVQRRARRYATLFVDEFAEPLDASAGDWDSTAWGEAVRRLGFTTEQADRFWPAFRAELIAETQRICAEPQA